MKELTLKVTVDETNLILEGLGNLPFAKVYAWFSKIQEQASQQLDGQLQANPSPDQPSPPQVSGGSDQ